MITNSKVGSPVLISKAFDGQHKTGPFLDPPMYIPSSFADVIYGWSLIKIELSSSLQINELMICVNMHEHLYLCLHSNECMIIKPAYRAWYTYRPIYLQP